MKIKKKLLTLLGISIVFISMKTIQTSTGPHGGRVKKVENFNIETKTNYSEYYTYLLNNKNEPISNKGISCEIEFLFLDNTSLDFPLKKYQEDGFKLESSITGYESYRITFYAFGKAIATTFENESAIVKKNK